MWFCDVTARMLPNGKPEHKRGQVTRRARQTHTLRQPTSLVGESSFASPTSTIFPSSSSCGQKDTSTTKPIHACTENPPCHSEVAHSLPQRATSGQGYPPVPPRRCMNAMITNQAHSTRSPICTSPRLWQCTSRQPPVQAARAFAVPASRGATCG